MQEWIGVGPSASSQYKNFRYTNVNSILQWKDGINSGKFNRYDQVKLSQEDIALDEILFGIRMNAGVNVKNNIHLHKFSELFSKLHQNGLVNFDGNHLSLTQSGRLLCDAIESEIFNQ
jgi:oxygen-independent coproporphyrinogen-3 oxidase